MAKTRNADKNKKGKRGNNKARAKAPRVEPPSHNLVGPMTAFNLSETKVPLKTGVDARSGIEYSTGAVQQTIDNLGMLFTASMGSGKLNLAMNIGATIAYLAEYQKVLESLERHKQGQESQNEENEKEESQKEENERGHGKDDSEES